MKIALPKEENEVVIQLETMHYIPPKYTSTPDVFDIASELYNIQIAMLAATNNTKKVSTNDYSVDSVDSDVAKPNIELILKPIRVKRTKRKHIKHSSLKSDNNPLTIARERRLKKGEPLKVHFDEIVVVRPVKQCDNVCPTFSDALNGQRTDNKNGCNAHAQPDEPGGSCIKTETTPKKASSVFIVVIGIILLCCI
eukprot:UN02244